MAGALSRGELEERVAELELELARLREEAAKVARVASAAAMARERLHAVAEQASHTGTWTWNLKTDEIEWSDEFYCILGLERDAVAPSSPAFFNAIHDDDRARIQSAAAASLEAGDPARLEYRIVRPGGEIREVSMQAALTVDERGERDFIVGTVRDVTEDRLAQGLLARTVDELNEAQRIARMGSFRIDLIRDQMEWSEGLYRIMGVDVGTPVARSHFWDAVHPDDLKRMREFQAKTRGPSHPPPVEFRIRRHDGEHRNVRMVQYSTRDESGTVLGMKGILEDVTEQRALESRLRQAEKMDAVGRLAGGIAHDFNNYLMVISGHAELLKDCLADDEDAQESVEAIDEVAERCARLTEQLLTFSRRHRAELREMDLNQLLAEMLPMLRTAIGASIELTVELEDKPAVIRADRHQMERAIVNLCLNARDAMPSGGQLRLSVDCVLGAELDTEPNEVGGPSEETAMVQLTIADSGSGIAPDVRARMFEPFFSTKGLGGGTGLGLATVYAIVRDGGGTIDVESESEQGTRIRVRLPRCYAEPASVPDVAQSMAQAQPNRRVLVVEDLPEVRSVICRHLSRCGYQVRSAEHGVDALEQLAVTPADVVVSDVVMPKMNGMELAERIQTQYPSTACVLITGYSSDILGPDGPAAVIIYKPFSVRQLVAAIESAASRVASCPSMLA